MQNSIPINMRKSILHMVHYSKASHVGSCLSIVEILYALYFKIMNIDPASPQKPDRDIFILSKAHGSAALYSVLAEKGFIPRSNLDAYFIDNGKLPGHLDMTLTPGIELSTGSLGHGLSVGIGMAIARKSDKNPGRVFVLIGDGESNEGSIWEGVILASTLKLNNLTLIVDYNKIQSFCMNCDIMGEKKLYEIWKSFGWETYEVDGHNVLELEKVFRLEQTGPKCVIAHTIKGKGVSFMENKLEWHYKSPDDEQYRTAIRELESTL